MVLWSYENQETAKENECNLVRIVVYNGVESSKCKMQKESSRRNNTNTNSELYLTAAVHDIRSHDSH